MNISEKNIVCTNQKNEFNYSNFLKSNWSEIFPDGNRNAAGAVFFNFIFNLKNLSFEEFIEFNKLYCAVSGSLVSPNSEPDFISLNDLDGNLICGYYYRCCWPCSCDLMKYAFVIEVKHQFCYDNFEINFFVIVIKNPCLKEDFPSEVNRDYFCQEHKINNNNVMSVKYLNEDYLIVGLLHNGLKCNENNISKIKNNKITGNMCNERNNTPLDNLNYGMGDIFIKMAS